jgi:bifunctional polynucleotide phosphatase/kinase
VLLCSPAGSGKSTLARRFEDTGKYSRINSDTLGSIEKCKKVAKIQLSENNMSVVIDNTNFTEKTRLEWITIAREFKIPIRCIHIEIKKEICFNLAKFRYLDPKKCLDERQRSQLNMV